VASLRQLFRNSRNYAKMVHEVTGMAKLIYLADDEAHIRDLMRTFLVSEGYLVQAFAGGDALLEAFSRLPADLVILDVMMPGTDGLQLCSQLRQRSVIPIIIVSARDSELDRITGISLGSDDYLTKPFSPIELVARVKALFRRLELDRGNPNAGQLTAGNLQLNPQVRTVTCQGQPLDVTPTEFALLSYLFANQDRAISRDELLRKVWQFDFDADTRAADDLIKRLRRKLSVIDCRIQIESVWGFGFRLAVIPESGVRT
jgi:DNA-binding response OmpR family regulator